MWNEESTDPLERAELSAASLINAVGALMDDLVEASSATQREIAARMGVTPGRVSQLLASDGNVRIATLARLAHACGSDVAFAAVDRRTGERITVPRGPRVGRSGHVPAAEAGMVADPVESSTMVAAALINAVGALMDDLIGAGPVKKQDIAARMGVTPARVSQLLAGDGNVRIATLARLAEAVGSDITLTATDRATGAQLVAPRSRVRGVRERQVAPAPAATTAQVNDRMKALAPVLELRRRGVLPGGTLAEERAALCDLLEIVDIWAEPDFLAVARRHNVDEPVSPRQKIWLACVRKAAREREAAPFDREAATVLAVSLTRTLRDPAGVAELPERLAGVGIRLVFVAPFPGNKISGVSFLLDGDEHKPVIALSGRGKRLDKVIFTLLHELAHVMLGHPRRAAFVIDEGEDGEGDMEAAANDLARRWALALPMTVPDDIDETWVASEAERQGVHRMIVVGRLQFTGALSWSSALGRHAPDVSGWLEGW